MPGGSPVSPAKALFDTINQQLAQINNWIRSASLSFLQIAGATQTFASWGAISGAGAIEAGTGDFTAVRNSTGIFTVTWKTAKTSAAYGVQITPVYNSGSELVQWQLLERTTTAFKVQLTESAVSLNASWSFTVLAAS